MKKLDDRYLKDKTFALLVDHFSALIKDQQTSFAELREAVLFAQLRYEMDNPSRIQFSEQLSREINLRIRGYL
jgi:hypothetical protein